jgi:hypothetical protein
MTLGLVVAAAGMGVFIISLVKNLRQSGPVIGAVLSLTGMIGGLMTTGVTLPPAFDLVTLSVPQGWALRGWNLAMAGAGLAEVLLPAVVLLAAGTGFFIAGAAIFRRRYA